MSSWKRRLRIAGLYGLVFVVSTILFFFVAFPWKRATRFAEAATAKSLDLDVRIGSLASNWLTGIEMENVTIRARKPDREGRFRTFHADRVEARIALSTIFGGDVDVDYRIETMGGTIEGQYYRAAADTRILARFDAVSPDELPLIRDLVGLPIRGRIDGTLDLTLRDHKFSKASGTIDLVARNVIVGDGKALLRLKVRPEFEELREFLAREDQGVAMPPMTVGTFTAKARVSRGSARIVELGATSEHFEFKGEGTISLHDPASTSEVGLYVMYKFTEAYQNSDSEMRSMLESMSRSPRYRQALRSDGFYGFRLQGILRERIRPFPARESGFANSPAPEPPPPIATEPPPPGPPPPPAVGEATIQ